MDESILETISQMIGPSASYEVFYTDLIIHINAAFSRLCQLGIGPKKPFRITDTSETWSDFMENDMPPEVIQYIYLKTRMMFDPPASNVMNAYKEQVDMLEWTLKETARYGY